MNEHFLVEGNVDLIRTDVAGAEEGVLYAYIVDPSAKILAPTGDAGKIVDIPDVILALQDRKLHVVEGKKNEMIYCQPIQHLTTVIGAAVIGVDLTRLMGAAGTGITVYANLVLILLLAACPLLAVFLIKNFLKPLRELEEDVSLAMKEGRTRIDYQSPYAEVQLLVAVFNRLLFINAINRSPEREKQVSTHTIPPDVPGAPAVPAAKAHASVPDLKEVASPWCIIEKETCTIEECNQQCRDLFGTSLRNGAHIMEAFSDPVIIQAMSQLLDNPQELEYTTSAAGKTVTIKKISLAENNNQFLFIFDEPANR
jgi:HAMP domain-containing protein